VLAVDEAAGKVYVSSNKDAVIDKQTYALNLDGSTAGKPVRITKGDGWHEATTFANNGKIFVDTFSDPEDPAAGVDPPRRRRHGRVARA
jgi:dipeptidyl-peptidase-4